MKIAVFGSEYKHPQSDDLLQALQANGMELLPEERASEAQVALSIGGDGTFLRTAHAVALLGIPIMGVNAGHLGYLTTADVTEVEKVVLALKNHDYVIEERAMLQLVAPSFSAFALNEIALLRQDTSSMITVDVVLDDTPLTACKGDGLLVCTPTGSTAYNLSVGGPILQPKSQCFAISPISPHALTMRPVVISDSATLIVTSHSRAECYQVSVDGQEYALPSGSTLKITKAAFPTRVIMLREHRFAGVLRSKLLWGLQNRD